MRMESWEESQLTFKIYLKERMKGCKIEWGEERVSPPRARNGS